MYKNSVILLINVSTVIDPKKRNCRYKQNAIVDHPFRNEPCLLRYNFDKNGTSYDVIKAAEFNN